MHTSPTDSNEDIMARAILIAQNTIDKKDKIIANLQPKAMCYDLFWKQKTMSALIKLQNP